MLAPPSTVYPLQENSASTKMPDPCLLVIFGATGDLTAKRLVPALYNLAREGLLPAHFAAVGFARRPKDDDIFRQDMHDAVAQHSRVKPIDEELWKSFREQLFYHRSEFDDEGGYERLRESLAQLERRLGLKGNRMYYLSTQPSYFPVVVRKLHEHGLLYDVREEAERWSRVVIEKPFGHDLQSALDLQQSLSQYLDEKQVFRIDHYLGKETVQNLLVLRFANPFFESLWNNRHIDHVQITVAEEQGIGTRGRFWEEAGMLRDIVQNHMMQLLSLVAMEPPIRLTASAIRDEKVKVLESLRPIQKDAIQEYAVRGQYGEGFSAGSRVCRYTEEPNVSPTSTVETYVALKLYIDNWRWAGVPFYLRAGKRLPKRTTEIAIFFREAPSFFCFSPLAKAQGNVLVIRIQPDEGIALRLNCKVPGLANAVQPVKMDFRYGSFFGATPPEAYERLIADCMMGDSTLFAREDEVRASWKFLTPLLTEWANSPPPSFPNYASGTWGPQEADRLLAREGRSWRLM